tara:strand:- start:7858 stop:8589 length:732 start_codon:yes stop_codon:yes gene_type:complete
MNWFENWFDSKYYHILYKKRDLQEAAILIDNLLKMINPAENSFFLDLGCGAGRHSIYLNQKGFHVDGVDLSKKSLKQAEEHQNEKLKFHLKDMRDFCFQNKYDIIINLFTSFGYFEDDQDNKKVFSNIEKSLKINGYFIIDFFNSHKIIRELKDYEIKKIDDIMFKIKRRQDGKFVYKDIYITDRKNSYTFTEKVRLIKQQQFINYAKNLNMKLTHTFGDYQLNKYEESYSDRLIMIFQKDNC